MSLHLSILEAVRHLAESLNRFAHRGEGFVSIQGRKPDAVPRPLPPGQPKTLGEMLASLPRLTPEEADSFAEDLQKARVELNRLPVRDPWGA